MKEGCVAPYLNGCHTVEGQNLFSIIPECRTHNNELKLQETRFQVEYQEKFLLEHYSNGTYYL